MAFEKKKRWLLLSLLIVGAGAYPLSKLFNPGDPAPEKPTKPDEPVAQRHHPLDDAERQIRDMLNVRPDHFGARIELISLLTLQCRNYAADAERRVLLRSGIWEIEDLLSLAKPEDLDASPDLKPLLRQDPYNPRLLLAEARLAMLTNRYDDAKEWLEQAIEAGPKLVDVHAIQGLYLLEQDPSERGLSQWQAGLPRGSEKHPDVWLVQGMLAREQQDLPGAARCFAEALLLFPNHRRATHQLSLVLATLGEEERAVKLSLRVKQLDQLSRSVDDIYNRSEWDEPWLRAASLMEKLGRLPEAAAWYRAIVQQNFGGEAAQEKAAALSAKVSPTTPMTSLSAHPLSGFTLEKYPLPKFESPKRVETADSQRPGTFRFTEVAEQTGLDFAYFGAEAPVLRVRRFVQLLGGGLGALDFDQDGWPDMYCAQGAPLGKDAPGDYRDRIFRNIGGTFDDVTELAGLGDESLSHGVAVGDFNQDGFPDLWVGNWGANRLYANNGDGTFSDVTDQAGISGQAWTASGVIADINGDGLPDIYEVNYLGGPTLDVIECLGGQDCSPAAFPAAQDRFYLNLGNGQFREQTEQAGFVAEDGKGLGILVGDFNGDGAVSVFVANDGVANQFFVNQASIGDMPRFVDRASLHGLAYGGNGLSQGCMGVAVDDVDGNGLIDLFVTNFYGEPNTLYTEQTGMLFYDETQKYGLRSPSVSMVGFGTEFLDVDLDGDPDLVVSNGQIDHVPGSNREFQMRPQFFENRNGRFYERSASEVAPYFGRELVGRCLTRLDFNRDGREDFAVSHLDAPVVLLRNDTPGAGHFLAIRLRGVSADRDALGATVTVVMGDGHRRVRQVTAGDGFECSNQKQLIFGLGEATSIAKIIVRWPTQDVQEFTSVKADGELLIIQSDPQPVLLPN